MPRGYTSVEAVAAYLGRTFTMDQAGQAEALLDVCESYIDTQTRRGWNLAPVIGERYDLTIPVVYLRQAPVTSVESVATRTTQVGDTPLTLTAGVDYELLDASIGEIRFVNGYSTRNAYVLVSYTPDRPVPADVGYAATLIVAESLRMTLFPDRWGIDQAQVDANRKLTYTDAGVTIHVPETAQTIITTHRKPLVV